MLKSLALTKKRYTCCKILLFVLEFKVECLCEPEEVVYAEPMAGYRELVDVSSLCFDDFGCCFFGREKTHQALEPLDQKLFIIHFARVLSITPNMQQRKEQFFRTIVYNSHLASNIPACLWKTMIINVKSLMLCDMYRFLNYDTLLKNV